MRCLKLSAALSVCGLLVVNKPVNVLTKRLLMLSKTAGLAVACQLVLVNRIDLLTSGLVALGIRGVSAKLRRKVYLCVVEFSIIGSRLRVSC